MPKEPHMPTGTTSEQQHQSKPRRRGRPGKRRISLEDPSHAEAQLPSSTTTGSNANNDSPSSSSYSHSANEIIPKVWIIANYSVAVAASIATQILIKGDNVVLGCSPGGHNEQYLLRQADRLIQRFPGRCIAVELDIRNYGLCCSTISKTIVQFGRIDVMVNCTSRAFVGALEEVEEWHVRSQMDQTFYGAVNMIQAALPYMRKQFFGHIINIADITGNIGTPALSLLSGATHALEGYLEALACEVAPFNIKVSIVESPMELSLLTTPLVFADPRPQYGPDSAVGRMRAILSASNHVFPELAFRNTVHTVVSIGGLENPPGRIVVGKEAIAQIKNKLALLSEDLEQFTAVSISADYADYNMLQG